MQISGQIKTPVPAAFLLTVMNDPDAMVQLLPAGSKLSLSGPGVFAFTMTKSIGPIRLTLPGTLTLAARGQGLNQQLTVHAAHLIGGKVDLELAVEISENNGMTRVGYDGTVEATGLAGRVLNEHHARANSVVKSALTRLRLQAERQYNQTQAAV